MLNSTVEDLEMKLAAARAGRDVIAKTNPIAGSLKAVESTRKRKHFMVIGINTAFSSRKRRDSIRATWMPQGSSNGLVFFNMLIQFLNAAIILTNGLPGEKMKKLEEEKGIVIRFVIGHR